ncbi:hypothetical protein [Yoonia vestfoldensis]|uniref:hypothetical protein n=1 Tax=Yoonia vestfoldensis TaxID=245188 RepID=UPI0003631E2A|nr:hypothetical protein [Yoonia vestfoldensis]
MSLDDPLLCNQTTARLSQLDDVEACVVIYRRLWCKGSQGRCARRADLAPHLTATAGSSGLRIRQMLVQRPETPAYLH